MVPSPTRVNLPSLTGLRYLAAAVVVVHHSTEVFGPETWLDRIAKNGYVGVAFFFVLSGFILSWTRDENVSRGTFYRRRFARIYPMYLATFVGAVLIAVIADIPGKSMIGVALGLVLLQAWFPQESIYAAGNPPAWSLSAEAFFYALFPFIAPRVARSKTPLWPAVSVVLILGVAYALSPIYSGWFAYFSPAYGLVYFVVGMLAANAVRRTTRAPSLPLSLAMAGLVFVACGIWLDGEPRGLVTALMLPPLVLVIVAAANGDMTGPRSMWSRSFVVKLGEWSFALYLIHFPMVRLINRAIDGPLDGGEFGALAGSIGVLVVGTAAAAAAYYLYERPAEKWLRGTSRRHRRELNADPI